MSDPLQPPPSPTRKQPTSRIKRCATWGAVAGFVVAKVFIRQNSPLGFYGGNMLLVFAVCIGLATAAGAGIGWAMSQASDDERFPG
jgi:hypothetical protein